MSGQNTTHASSSHSQHLDLNIPSQPVQDDIMDETEGPIEHSAEAEMFLSPEYKTLAKVFGKVHELPCTRAMKTRVKNLISRLGRLQQRLLKYTALAPPAGNDILADDHKLGYITAAGLGGGIRKLNIPEIKKLYQFRLVDVHTIRIEVLDSLTCYVCVSVVSMLLTDVNKDI